MSPGRLRRSVSAALTVDETIDKVNASLERFDATLVEFNQVLERFAATLEQFGGVVERVDDLGDDLARVVDGLGPLTSSIEGVRRLGRLPFGREGEGPKDP